MVRGGDRNSPWLVEEREVEEIKLGRLSRDTKSTPVQSLCSAFGVSGPGSPSSPRDPARKEGCECPHRDAFQASNLVGVQDGVSYPRHCNQRAGSGQKRGRCDGIPQGLHCIRLQGICAAGRDLQRPRPSAQILLEQDPTALFKAKDPKAGGNTCERRMAAVADQGCLDGGGIEDEFLSQSSYWEGHLQLLIIRLTSNMAADGLTGTYAELDALHLWVSLFL